MTAPFFTFYDKKGRGPVLVLESDRVLFEQHTWRIFKPNKRNRTFYVATTVRTPEKRTSLLLHRHLMQPPTNLLVDHKNGDGLDNRRDNLRLATRNQNAFNAQKASPKRSSQYKGVIWSKRDLRWCATINGTYLGNFRSEVDAAKAYNTEAKVRFGEFAKLNEVPE